MKKVTYSLIFFVSILMFCSNYEDKNYKSKIAYISNNRLYIMNPNGTKRKSLTESKYLFSAPSWSPDCKKIIYSAIEDKFSQIFIIDTGKNEEDQITSTDFDISQPVISPDGKKIVFVSSKDMATEIYALDLNSLDITRLTDNEYFDDSPDWSPDGERIVFVSRRFGEEDIFIMNADGSAQDRLTLDGGISPAWSPDGEKIAFISKKDEPSGEVYIIGKDGLELKRITFNKNKDWTPDWSPDGKKLIFISIKNNISEMLVLDLETLETKRLLSAYNLLNPVWSTEID